MVSIGVKLEVNMWEMGANNNDMAASPCSAGVNNTTPPSLFSRKECVVIRFPYVNS